MKLISSFLIGGPLASGNINRTQDRIVRHREKIEKTFINYDWSAASYDISGQAADHFLVCALIIFAFVLKVQLAAPLL